MSAPDARTARELQMMESLVDGAYALATACCEAAKAQRDTAAMLKLVEAYQRMSQAVRLGIRLSMALRAPARPAAAQSAAAAEADPVEVEKDDSRTPPERMERLESERDRDYEPVSLPRFLASLRGAAAEAGRLADQLPPEVATETLPTLRRLLAEAGAEARPRTVPQAGPPAGPQAGARTALAVLARPPGPAPKASLLASASAPPPRPAGPGGPAFPRPPPRPR